ncbi:MAG: ferredoxin [Clostridiaceae bacterium]|nr:ferredoxin [Bacillota bacterium]NLI39004.1 ferredoxin [Clostridiaceae bacterium]
MKAWVDKDGCISCGLCPTICPEVFRMGDDDLAEAYVDTVPSDSEDAAREAADSCPVSVIHIEE